MRMNFESVEALISYADHSISERFVKRESKEVSNSRTNFTGVRNWEQALKNAREGKEVDKIDAVLNQVTKGQIKETMSMSVAGAYVDIGAYLGGSPDNMVMFEQEENPKFATIVIDIVESSGVDQEYFTNKAIATAYLVDSLQNNGFRVEVIGVCGVVIKGILHEMVFTIKKHEQHLSIAQVSGCIISSFFRRIGFGWIERIFWEQNSLNADNSSYGRPDRAIAQEFKKRNDCIVIESHMVGDWKYSKERTIEKLNNIITTFNENN
jgi:hypothetical protein